MSCIVVFWFLSMMVILWFSVFWVMFWWGRVVSWVFIVEVIVLVIFFERVMSMI